MSTENLAKGKRAEMLVFGELVRQRVGLYTPVVDLEGIDAIARKKDGTFVGIQVKSTEKENQAGCFNVWDLDRLGSTEKRFLVCVDTSKEKSGGPIEFWFFPEDVFKDYALKVPIKTGASKGSTLYRLDVNSRSRKHGNRLRRDDLKSYLNAWHLLTS